MADIFVQGDDNEITIEIHNPDIGIFYGDLAELAENPGDNEVWMFDDVRVEADSEIVCEQSLRDLAKKYLKQHHAIEITDDKLDVKFSREDQFEHFNH